MTPERSDAGSQDPRRGEPGGEIVRMEAVYHRYGRVVALDGASLSVTAGEVHGVLGENGAGKTTLLSVLAGLRPLSEGRITFEGTSVRPTHPRDAWALGIGMVHQHFSLVPRFSVIENLALGPGGVRLRVGALRARAEALMARTGLQAPLEATVEELGVGDRQRVEILRTLLRNPRVLILDEPTAVLTPAEVERLLGLLRGLASDGIAVVLVAHKLDEVLSVADRVTVLRGGRTVLEARRREIDEDELVRAMVGSLGTEEAKQVERARGAGSKRHTGRTGGWGEVVARLEQVTVQGSRGELAVQRVDLEVRRGEVVGIAGVEGNGQRELAQVLARRRSPDGGRASLPDEPGYIPQDRAREGLVPDFTLGENLALSLHRLPDYRRGWFVDWRRVEASATRLLDEFSVSPATRRTHARALSGGNQQRLVVARELARVPDLLVAENPTRGLDVTASAFVHERLGALRDAGVVLLSTDLDEILRISDRVLVMIRGRLARVPPEEQTREGVGRWMLKGTGEPA